MLFFGWLWEGGRLRGELLICYLHVNYIVLWMALHWVCPTLENIESLLLFITGCSGQAAVQNRQQRSSDWSPQWSYGAWRCALLLDESCEAWTRHNSCQGTWWQFSCLLFQIWLVHLILRIHMSGKSDWYIWYSHYTCPANLMGTSDTQNTYVQQIWLLHLILRIHMSSKSDWYIWYSDYTCLANLIGTCDTQNTHVWQIWLVHVILRINMSGISDRYIWYSEYTCLANLIGTCDSQTTRLANLSGTSDTGNTHVQQMWLVYLILAIHMSSKCDWYIWCSDYTCPVNVIGTSDTQNTCQANLIGTSDTQNTHVQ